jgi:hypothetical protein
MELEDYFHQIQQEKPMIHKDTAVTITIDQDNSDLDDFPNQYIQQRMEYSGTTWMKVLEDIIKVLEVHYGYPISENVFYAVNFPMFDHNVSPAPGRELKKTDFLQLLAEHPELNNGGKHQPIEYSFEIESEE